VVGDPEVGEKWSENLTGLVPISLRSWLVEHDFAMSFADCSWITSKQGIIQLLQVFDIASAHPIAATMNKPWWTDGLGVFILEIRICPRARASCRNWIYKGGMLRRLGLKRGQWKMLLQLLELPTTFQIRPTERDGLPCWEAYFPPVSAQLEGNTKQELTGAGR